MPGVPSDMALRGSENRFLRMSPIRRRYLWMDDPVWDNTFVVSSQDSESEVRNFLDQKRRDRMARLDSGWKLNDSIMHLRKPTFNVLNGAHLQVQIKKLIGIARVIIGDSTDGA